ncbi:UvrB/UvrC motif-containing protein [soil metagenome]
MQCETCGNSEAVIKFTKVEDDQTRVFRLCEQCALEQGVDVAPAPASAPLADFLAQIGKSVGDEVSAAGECPSCGLTPAQLKQLGRLGCAQCYAHYEQHLRGLLRRLHGATHHAGKVPATPDGTEMDRTARAQSLRRSLQRAVDEEDFENAAILRDQIRRLESVE